MPTVEGSELRAQVSSSASIEEQRLSMLHKKSLSESHEIQEGEALAPKVDLKSVEVSNNFQSSSASSQKKHDIFEIAPSTPLDVSESIHTKDTEKSIDTEALKSLIENLESKSKELSEVELDYLIDTFIESYHSKTYRHPLIDRLIDAYQSKNLSNYLYKQESHVHTQQIWEDALQNPGLIDLFGLLMEKLSTVLKKEGVPSVLWGFDTVIRESFNFLKSLIKEAGWERKTNVVQELEPLIEAYFQGPNMLRKAFEKAFQTFKVSPFHDPSLYFDNDLALFLLLLNINSAYASYQVAVNAQLRKTYRNESDQISNRYYDSFILEVKSVKKIFKGVKDLISVKCFFSMKKNISSQYTGLFSLSETSKCSFEGGFFYQIKEEVQKHPLCFMTSRSFTLQDMNQIQHTPVRVFGVSNKAFYFMIRIVCRFFTFGPMTLLMRRV